LRTQELRRQKLNELGSIKEKKSEVLEIKDKEAAALETQKQEKDKIVSDLKKEGKELNNQLTAYKKQNAKVEKAIAAAIKKARNDANIAAMKKKKEDNAANLADIKNNTAPKTNPEKTTSPVKRTDPVKAPDNVLLNEGNIALNESFKKNRGLLPWPVDKGIPILHYGQNRLPSGGVIDVTGVTISTDIGSNVKAVFDGVVSSVVFIEDMQVVIIQHGEYFSTYSNLGSVSVKGGQNVKTGQVIGKAAANLDGNGSIDLYINDAKGNDIDPERWLKR
jgi:murein hydrolase activator